MSVSNPVAWEDLRAEFGFTEAEEAEMAAEGGCLAAEGACGSE